MVVVSKGRMILSGFASDLQYMSELILVFKTSTRPGFKRKCADAKTEEESAALC